VQSRWRRSRLFVPSLSCGAPGYPVTPIESDDQGRYGAENRALQETCERLALHDWGNWHGLDLPTEIVAVGRGVWNPKRQRHAIAIQMSRSIWLNTGKQSLVRELSKNRRRTEVSVSRSGSPGAVGRHSNTPTRVTFGCRCHEHPLNDAFELGYSQMMIRGLNSGNLPDVVLCPDVVASICRRLDCRDRP